MMYLRPGLGGTWPSSPQTRPSVGQEAGSDEVVDIVVVAMDDLGSSDVEMMMEVVVVTPAVVVADVDLAVVEIIMEVVEEADVDSSVDELAIEIVVEPVVSVEAVVDSSLVETVAIEDVSKMAVLVVNVGDRATEDEPGLQTSASAPTAAKATAKTTIILKAISTSKS